MTCEYLVYLYVSHWQSPLLLPTRCPKHGQGHEIALPATVTWGKYCSLAKYCASWAQKLQDLLVISHSVALPRIVLCGSKLMLQSSKHPESKQELLDVLHRGTFYLLTSTQVAHLTEYSSKIQSGPENPELNNPKSSNSKVC
jgi:hypothetical protein